MAKEGVEGHIQGKRRADEPDIPVRAVVSGFCQDWAKRIKLSCVQGDPPPGKRSGNLNDLLDIAMEDLDFAPFSEILFVQPSSSPRTRGRRVWRAEAKHVIMQQERRLRPASVGPQMGKG